MSVFPLEDHVVHLWTAFLPHFVAAEKDFLNLLDAEEIHRANRFHFPIHRQRFILSHGLLRQLLSRYSDIAPADIFFIQGPRGKPFLANQQLLQFNMSHSQDMAVYALTRTAEIGVDVEKKELRYSEDVAKRFFSSAEYHALSNMDEAERASAFYRIWTRKEAFIKALGEGLYTPLANFSVSSIDSTESLAFTHQGQETHWHIENFLSHPDYQSAFATNQPVKQVHCASLTA